ncbi:hypothetical protein [Anaeromyxobacter dehalogenans]|uniref:hypothetical protein n=1 Tax=Anaeromyxobacter dehalogenans TaxID=161493 RepID=UPI00059E625C|nr:hypothetical protein [Anaeromyxobacter dehalogenans]
MTRFETRLLKALRARPERTVSDLGAELGRGRVDVTRALLWLERDRLVVRTRYPRGCATWCAAPAAAQPAPAARRSSPSRRDPERTRREECRSCGARFVAIRAHNGKFPKTCSAPCRLAALDRYIAGLQRARDTLAEQIDGDASRGPGRR